MHFFFTLLVLFDRYSTPKQRDTSSIPVLKLVRNFYHLSPFVFVGYTVTSVVSARNGQLYVAGAPRFNHTGKVIIFTMKNTGELTILHSLKGQQVKHLKTCLQTLAAHCLLKMLMYSPTVFCCSDSFFTRFLFVCILSCLTVSKHSKAAFPLLSRTVLRTARNGSRLTVQVECM